MMMTMVMMMMTMTMAMTMTMTMTTTGASRGGCRYRAPGHRHLTSYSSGLPEIGWCPVRRRASRVAYAPWARPPQPALRALPTRLVA